MWAVKFNDRQSSLCRQLTPSLKILIMCREKHVNVTTKNGCLWTITELPIMQRNHGPQPLSPVFAGSNESVVAWLDVPKN